MLGGTASSETTAALGWKLCFSSQGVPAGAGRSNPCCEQRLSPNLKWLCSNLSLRQMGIYLLRSSSWKEFMESQDGLAGKGP